MDQFAEEEIDESIEISRRDANQLIPSLEAAYAGLLIKVKYLTKKTSSIIISEYLMKVLFDQVFVPQTDEIKIGVLLKPVKKYSIIQELMLIPLPENQQWRIDEKHQPDKSWVVNVLKTVKPNSTTFRKYSPEKTDMKTLTNEQLSKFHYHELNRKIRTLDLSTGKKGSVRRFFRIDKDKQLQIQQKKKIDQKKNLERKIQRKKESLKKVEKEIQSIGQKMQNI